MSEPHVETEERSGSETDQVESSLQKLWEKARRLSEVLLRIQKENQALRRRVEELEGREKQLSGELQGQEQELLKLQSNGSGMFTHEEKEALASKIKDLIAKINARL